MKIARHEAHIWHMSVVTDFACIFTFNAYEANLSLKKLRQMGLYKCIALGDWHSTLHLFLNLHYHAANLSVSLFPMPNPLYQLSPITSTRSL